MGVRKSSSPVIISTGVETLPTRNSDEVFSHASGSSQNGLSKNE